MDKTSTNGTVKFFNRKQIPLEMHKVKVVQALNLVPVERRLDAIGEAGYNSFLLKTTDVFLDMLTDSGTNAQSDAQISKMFIADEAYAGSQSFTRFEQSILQIFGKKFVLPVHQGRAAENILGKSYVKEGSVVPTNYHFTTTLAHIMLNGGKVLELYAAEAMKVRSSHPFKGNMDLGKLEDAIKNIGPENIPFIIFLGASLSRWRT
jgi:tyrosine phenol-lyase